MRHMPTIPRHGRWRFFFYLTDGRTLSVPLVWFPRLLAATPAQLAEWRLVGGGEGIRWEALDEDLSVRGLLRGERARR
jgi:hypothetical protein